MSTPLVDDLDLDYGSLGLEDERDFPLSPPTVRPPSEGRRDYEFAALVQRIKAEKAAKSVRGSAGGEAVVVIPSTPIADDDLPVSARGIARRCRAAGFTVRCQWTLLEVAPLRYVGESDGHDVGDERTPAYERTTWGVQAVLEAPGGRVAAFWATWERADVPGRKSVSNAFAGALCWDPIQHRFPAGTASEFEEWLAIFAPPLPKPAKKAAAKK